MRLSDEQMRIYEILEHAAEGAGLPDDEIEVLYGVDALSREAFVIRRDGSFFF